MSDDDLKPPAGDLYGELVTIPGDQTAWEFRFDVLDPTPGGANLGRIEWMIEPVPIGHGRPGLRGLLVWATQTRDPRLEGKTFWIPKSLDTGLQGKRFVREPGASSFLENVWMVMACKEHGGIVLCAYPQDHHERLHLDLNSSIFVRAEFRP